MRTEFHNQPTSYRLILERPADINSPDTSPVFCLVGYRRAVVTVFIPDTETGMEGAPLSVFYYPLGLAREFLGPDPLNPPERASIGIGATVFEVGLITVESSAGPIQMLAPFMKLDFSYLDWDNIDTSTWVVSLLLFR